MKKIIVICGVLLLAGCTPSETEYAHSFVTASQIKTAEEMCKPNGGLREINAQWYGGGRGYSFTGYKITGTCNGNSQGLNISFSFSEDAK